MRLKGIIAALIAMSALQAMAGIKEDFVDGVVKSCGKPKEEAEKMATPGRTGNVVKWQMCKSGTVDIDGCSLTCVDSSSKIGN
jgi:riboflavin synthase alpha subunit